MSTLEHPPAPSLSVVLLAFNEEASIARAIVEARQFCRAHCGDYELILVDDGSADATVEKARACDAGDLAIVRHAHNLGMGAALRDGYRAAQKDYVVALPGDRQIRADSLRAFLPYLAPDRVVVSDYAIPHSGPARKLLSLGFRIALRTVGGYRVKLEGAYIFPRPWLARVDAELACSDTFLYSFQLLEEFRRARCRFASVTITPFPRAHGRSRVATPKRIAQMLGEIARDRVRRTVRRTLRRTVRRAVRRVRILR